MITSDNTSKEIERKANLKDFYDYKYWRENQRKQLTISSNIYFVFSSAVLGFIIQFLLNKNNIEINCFEKAMFIFSLFILFISLFFYTKFNDNRLEDFRKTSRLIYKGNKTAENIAEETKELGDKSWEAYHIQKCSTFIGVVLALIGFGSLILKL